MLNIQFFDLHQFVNFIVNTPKDLMVEKTQQEKFTLYAALILEFVWQLRNKAVHEGIKPRKEELKRGVQRKFQEHWKVVSNKSNRSPPPTSASIHWAKPEKNAIKINYDAAVGVEDSAVALIARDWRGNLVFSISYKVNTSLSKRMQKRYDGQLPLL